MMSHKAKLVFLVHAGSSHTNLKAVQKAIEEGKINAEISVVVLDSESLPNLDEIAPDYICLAGWKKIIPDELVLKYKILNVHPGLIPETMEVVVKNPDDTDALWNKGKYADKAIQNFLDQKATYAGSSIHFLTNEFDFGPVQGRTFEKIEAGDTAESLYQRLKVKENELYVEVLAKLCQ